MPRNTRRDTLTGKALTPSRPRYTQRERDEAAVSFGLWLNTQGFEREYLFARPRRYRFDYCHLPLRLAVEVDGGQWLGAKGRHTNPQGFERDLEKMNLAALKGYTVLRFTIDMIVRGEAVRTVEAVMEARQVA